jgi:hypothetical protein
VNGVYFTAVKEFFAFYYLINSNLKQKKETPFTLCSNSINSVV